MAFGPLCQSILPKICIGRCPSPISCSLMHLDTFKNRYMTYGSIMMCLGRPYLPIAVAINGLPTKKDVKFLREYCNKIGSLEINLLSNSDAITNRPLPNIFFQMESLRSLVVTWGDGKSAHNYILQEFLRGVLKSKRITMVKYIYPLCSLSEYIPEAPEKITHLEVTGTCNNLLGIVLTPTPRLQSFQLNLSGVQGNYAIPILNHFLERTCHTLENLQIKHKNAQMFRGHIRIPYIQRLTSLEVEIPFIFISQQPMRKLQNMESFLSRKQRMCSNKILRPKVSKASLDLNWKKWNYISPLESAAKLEKMYEDNYLKNLELPNLGNAANIEEVSLNNLPFHVALGIMPKIYISILNISRLTLNLRRSLAVSSFATADTNYLMEILTGFIQSDIPFDPRRWPNMLTNKNNAITTLKSKFPTLYL